MHGDPGTQQDRKQTAPDDVPKRPTFVWMNAGRGLGDGDDGRWLVADGGRSDGCENDESDEHGKVCGENRRVSDSNPP
jgi:hypothetical protein